MGITEELLQKKSKKTTGITQQLLDRKKAGLPAAASPVEVTDNLLGGALVRNNPAMQTQVQKMGQAVYDAVLDQIREIMPSPIEATDNIMDGRMVEDNQALKNLVEKQWSEMNDRKNFGYLYQAKETGEERLGQIEKEIQAAEKTRLDNPLPVGAASGMKFAQTMQEDPQTAMEQAQKNLQAQEEIRALEREKERINYILDNVGKTFDDNFFGQFGASYALGRMRQDESLAWNKYLEDPTEVNRAYAEAIGQLANKFEQENEATLAPDATLPWVSQSLANYLPQLADQVKYSAVGAIGGGAAGSAVPVLGTATGIKAGITAASGLYSYQTMRGAAFKSLLDLGVDEETAKAAANDEAVVSSLIEMADTGIDLLTLGGGKLITALTKGGVKTLAKEGAEKAAESAGKKLIKALGKYGLNVAGEFSEEAAQQAVSIANADRVSKGADDGILGLMADAGYGVLWEAAENRDDPNRAEILKAGYQGAIIAGLMGPLQAGVNQLAYTGVTAMDTKASADYGQQLRQQGLENTVIEAGLKFQEGSQVRRMADAISQKQKSGQQITDAELGDLYRAIKLGQQQAYQTTVQQAQEAMAGQQESAAAQQAEGILLPTADEVEVQARAEAETNPTRRSGILAGAREADMESAARLSKALGRNVQFFREEAGPAGTVNGYYDANTGTIYINSRSQNPVAQIIAHELTHSVEMAESYGELRAVVIEQMERDGVDIAKRRIEMRELYARNNKPLLDDIEADQEIVAQFVEQKLLTDEQTIVELTRTNRTLMERILEWINRTLQRIGLKKTTERDTLERAREIYARALRESGREQQGVPFDQVVDQSRKPDIRHSISDGQERRNAETALEHFGETEKWAETGYLTVDGHRLDFSGRHWGGDGGYREVDHRDISEALGDDYGGEDYSGALIRFMAEGNIRVSPESNGVDLSVRPTEAQEKALRDYFDWANGAVTLDISSTEGTTITSVEYPEGTSADRIIQDIRRYFDSGEKPRVSETQRFRYSVSETYAEEIDQWDENGRPDGEVFVLGSTGDVLQGLGAMEQDIYLRSEKINKILQEHPEMTLEEIKRVPEILDDPVLIMKSRNRKGKNSRLVIFGAVKAKNGKPILSVLDLLPSEGRLQIDDMQKVNSAYTRDNARNYIEGGEILYADGRRTIPLLNAVSEKNHRDSSSDRLAHTGPIGLLRSGSMGSITYGDNTVNISGIPFREIVSTKQPWDNQKNRYSISDDTNDGSGPYEWSSRFLERDQDLQSRVQRAKEKINTPEFRKWFQDSQVKNVSGEPLLVFHGAKDYFTKFRGNDKPIWFSPNAWYASKYANDPKRMDKFFNPTNIYIKDHKIIPAYLSASNMAEIGNTDNPFTETLETLAERTKIPENEWAEVWEQVGRPESTWQVINTKETARLLQKYGYDGIIATENKTSAYAVFNPNQVKSAIANKGTFKSTNEDIRYSVSDDQQREVNGKITKQTEEEKNNWDAREEAMNLWEEMEEKTQDFIKSKITENQYIKSVDQIWEKVNKTRKETQDEYKRIVQDYVNNTKNKDGEERSKETGSREDTPGQEERITEPIEEEQKPIQSEMTLPTAEDVMGQVMPQEDAAALEQEESMSSEEMAKELQQESDAYFEGLLEEAEQDDAPKETITKKDLQEFWDMVEGTEEYRKLTINADDKVRTDVKKKSKTAGQSIKEAYRAFIRIMVDSGEAVQRAGKIANDARLYEYYNAARAASSAAENMIQNESTDILGRKTGESLAETLKNVRSKGQEYYRKFQLYLYHTHNVDRMSLENLANVQQAQEAFAEVRNSMPELGQFADYQIEQMAKDPGSRYYAEARDYIAARDAMRRAEGQRNKPVFGPEVTADVSRQEAAELLREYPEFEEEAQKVYDYLDNLMQYRIDSGLVTEQEAQMLKQIYPHYVPVYREFERSNTDTREKNRVQIGKTIRRAKGGEEIIMPLHKSMALQTRSVVREGTKNRFGSRLLEDQLSRSERGRELVKNVQETVAEVNANTFDQLEDTATKRNNVFTVLQDGKRYDMEVDPSLFTAVEALGNNGEAGNNILTATVRKFNNLFKAMVTGYNPAFMARNFIRDLQDAALYSKDAKAWAANYPAAIKEIASNGEYWRQYKALGGVHSSVFDYETGMTRESKNPASKILNRVEALNMAVEQAPRLAEFIATVKKAENAEAGVTMDTLMEALYNANDITTNFGRSGTIGKWLNANLVPFLNPSIQGFDKMLRQLGETKGFKSWANLAAKAALLGIAPAVINQFVYGDEDDWDKIKQRDRDVYYLFKIGDGKWLKIPKGRALSLVGMAANRTIEAARGEQIDILDTLNTAISQTAPSNPLENNILQAWMDADLLDKDSPGKTWYGSDIESQRLQNYAPGERYDQSTDKLSKFLGQATGLSPAKINYLLDQYTGVVGDILLPMITPSDTSIPGLAPVVSAFTLDTAYSNRTSGDFYETLDQLTYEKNKEDANGYETVVYRFFNKQADAVGEINAAIREIEADEALSDAEKRELSRAQYQIRNSVEEQALDKVAAYQAAAEKYYEASDKEDEEDKIEEAYREANREIMGAEYALKTYSKEVYERAAALQEDGVSYDTFFDLYFDNRDTELTGYEKTNRTRDLLRELDVDEEQKKALYKDFVSDSETNQERIKSLEDAGATFDDFLTIQNKYNEINETVDKAKQKSVAFAYWLDTEGFTEEQSAAAQGAFKFYSQIPGQDTTYEKFKNSGLSAEEAYRLAAGLDTLEPDKGNETVSKEQKWREVLDSDLSSEKKLAALKSVSTETQAEKFEIADAYGVDLEEYVSIMERLPEFDADGNGRYTQAEVTNAINSILGGGTGGLVLPDLSGGLVLPVAGGGANRDKAVLWQLITGSKSAKNNPYSVEIGEEVLQNLGKNSGGLVLPDLGGSSGGLVLPDLGGSSGGLVLPDLGENSGGLVLPDLG